MLSVKTAQNILPSIPTQESKSDDVPAKKGDYIFKTGAGEIIRLKALNTLLNRDTCDLLDRFRLEGKTILEVGCGLGIISAELAKRVGKEGKVAAIDNSDNLLNFAREHGKEQGVSNVDYLNVDIYDIDTQTFSQKFDVLYGRYIIVNLSNPVQAIEHLLGLLKEGGTIILEEAILNQGFCYPPNEAYKKWQKILDVGLWKNQKDPTIGLQLHSIFERKNIKVIEQRMIQPLLNTPEKKSLVTQSLSNSKENTPDAPEEFVQLISELRKLENEDCIIGSAPTMQIVGQLPNFGH
ncbi:class I SAM-dependent methyltransferase [Parachlamydia acanthamoebae]|uniref:Methyltransferase domain-containing protein n=1 Tax=Parachlamydia acanthamoebae TaxID=83552 RepID=A0A0C1BWW2_9BACT|nr:methyltransferase domain-containing protein [Parachlamydia acanthamoebae]KIA76071.1 hypothetical protein DB43_BH00020 [Parachlamydia acanthamoebae]